MTPPAPCPTCGSTRPAAILLRVRVLPPGGVCMVDTRALCAACETLLGRENTLIVPLAAPPPPAS